MAIQLRYDVSPQLTAQAAMLAGQGQYAQQQQQVELERQRLAQQAELANAEMGLRERLAALNYQQNSRQLGQSAYQFDRELEARAAGQQQQLAAQVYGDQLQQQGFADMRDHQAAMQTQEIEARQAANLTQEQARIKEQFQNRQFTTGIASAQKIMEAWPTLNEEQRQQALGQWESRFKDTVGEFPFFQQQAPKAPPVSRESVKQSLQSTLGTAYMDGMEGIMGHEEEGQWVWDLEPQQRANIILGLKADETKRIQSEAQAQQQAATKKREQEIKFKQVSIENDRKRIAHVITGMEKLKREEKKNQSGAITVRAYTPTDADRQRLMGEAEMLYPDLTPDLYGIE